MEVFRATDYGSRLVLVVVENPAEPEWVHTVGEPMRDSHGDFMFTDGGEEVLVESASCLLGETGEACHNCHYNWRVHELVFDGDERYTLGDYGELRYKTMAEIQVETLLRLPAEVVPQDRPEFVGMKV